MKDRLIKSRLKRHKGAVKLLLEIQLAKEKVDELKVSLSGYACSNFSKIRKDTEQRIKRYELLVNRLTHKYLTNYR